MGEIMKMRPFLSDTRGATAIEYGLIVALIALAMLGGLQTLGGDNGGIWADNDQKITAALNGTGG